MSVRYEYIACDSANIYRSGYNVVTTCSPQNFEYVKKLGAEDVFNYVCKILKPPASHIQ